MHINTKKIVYYGYSMLPVLLIYLSYSPFYRLLRYLFSSITCQYIVAIIPAVVVGLFMLGNAFNKIKLLPILVGAFANILLGSANVYKIVNHLCLKTNIQDLKGTFAFFAKLNYLVLIAYCIPIISGIIALRYFIYKSRLNLKKADKNCSDNFGTGRIASIKEIRQADSATGLPVGLIPLRDNFSSVNKMLEYMEHAPGRDILKLKSVHSIIIGNTGSGKGVGYIVPTLLEYKGGVLVLDPKNGENYTIVKRRRLEMGRKVLVFDPFQITEDVGVKINVFDLLDANSKDLFDDASTIANLICPVEQDESSNSKHFQEGAGALILCFILHVACSNSITESNRNLSYVYELLCLSSEDLDEVLRIIISEQVAFGGAARLANSILALDYRERSGILSSAKKEIRFIDTPYVKEATSNGNFNLKDMVDGEYDLFVCIPLRHIDSQYRLLRLITGCLFLQLEKYDGYKGKQDLLMILDEMPSLGFLPFVDKALIYGRAFGAKIIGLSITIEKLRQVYPKTWKTFLSSSLVLFFSFTEKDVKNYISEEFGKTTIKVISKNSSSGEHKKAFQLIGSISSNQSESDQESSRVILMPEEVAQLGRKIVVVFCEGVRPIICHKLDYRYQLEWQGMWDDNLFYINKITDSSDVANK
jgi:type IV secretion system protein VirD4